MNRWLSYARVLANEAGAKELLTDADALVEKSIWLIGGDGWAYDIISAVSTTS